MRKILKFLVSRTFTVAILIIIQVCILINVFYLLNIKSATLNTIFTLISYVIVLIVINRNDNPSYKLVWSILILIFPFIGGVFYLLFGAKKMPKALFNSAIKSKIKLNSAYLDNQNLDIIKKENPSIAKVFRYIENCAHYPIYDNSRIEYLSDGNVFLKSLLETLKSAQNTIYIEYFIIAKGYMWDQILEILIAKANDGVDVKIIFDDAGSIGRIDNNYDKYLAKFNIKCVIFNRLKPQLIIQMNNRDHRKITVVDNKVAYMGGINIADEYINRLKRFGYWKDTAIKIEGEAVYSCSIMFIQFYNFLSKDKINYNLLKKHIFRFNDGLVLPFSDSPTDDEQIGLNTHLMLINSATKYIYIETPYLIIDYKLQKALCLAAKSGVDVKIVLPFIPDKWYVHVMSKYNYSLLVKSGVKIYEYKPGFIHSKIIIVDDIVGMCGSINMDYRSYYLHFECATLFYKSKAIVEMKKDFINIINDSIVIDDLQIENVGIFTRIIGALLNLFSPML